MSFPGWLRKCQGQGQVICRISVTCALALSYFMNGLVTIIVGDFAEVAENCDGITISVWGSANKTRPVNKTRACCTILLKVPNYANNDNKDQTAIQHLEIRTFCKLMNS